MSPRRGMDCNPCSHLAHREDAAQQAEEKGCAANYAKLVSSLINSLNKFGRFFRLLAHTDLANFSKFTSI